MQKFTKDLIRDFIYKKYEEYKDIDDDIIQNNILGFIDEIIVFIDDETYEG